MALPPLSRLSWQKQMALLFFAAGMCVLVIYVGWFVPKSVIDFIAYYQLDKAMHLSGGILIAATYEWLRGRRRIGELACAVLAIAVAWEVYEFFLDTRTEVFYQWAPDLWRLDTAGDIAAALLGAYGYGVFFMKREGKQKPSV